MNHECRQAWKDEGALFDQLFQEQSCALHSYLLGRTGNNDVADDLLQETFLRVWRHIREVADIPSERRRFWLFAVARNIVRDYYRRRAVLAKYEVPLPDRLPAGNLLEDPARAAEIHETASAVDAAMERLPEDLRTALTMRLLAEMSSAEIGEVLGIPPGTVRYRIARARRLVAKELGLVADSTE